MEIQGIQGRIQSLIQNFDNPFLWSLLLGLLLLVIIQITVGRNSQRNIGDGSSKLPRSPPSGLGLFYGLQFLIDRTGFLLRTSKTYAEGVFLLKFGGIKHHFIYNPDLISSLLDLPDSIADASWISSRLLRNNLGLSRQDALLYQEAEQAMNGIMSESSQQITLPATIDQVKRHIADLITFNSSPADQPDWEALAGAEPVQDSKGETFVQLDLMSLVSNFVAKTSSVALFGTDFIENFPDIWKPLWAYGDGFFAMLIGLPAWVPWPSLQRSQLARRKAVACTYEFSVAMDKFLSDQDPGSRWQDLDNTSDIIKQRATQFHKQGISMEARAAADFGLLWSVNATTGPVVSWMVFEIYRDPVILGQIRQEIAPYVKIAEPSHEFGDAVWVAPEFEILDTEHLVLSCPLLKASYIETLRLYTNIFTTRVIREDTVVKSTNGKESYMLSKGSYMHIPYEVLQLDEDIFSDAQEWRPERHIKETTTTTNGGVDAKTAVFGIVGMDSGLPLHMSKSRAVACQEALIYVAAILTLYDIQAPEGLSWEVPKNYLKFSVRYPTLPINVWIKRRKV